LFPHPHNHVGLGGWEKIAGACSGLPGWVHNKRFCRRGVLPVKGSSDTLLGFETTGPCPWLGVGGCRSALVVGCVVFDSWIVVASI
jgi:hypothetical protein